MEIISTESTTHFSLHCPFFFNERRTRLSTRRSLDSKLLDFTDYDLTQTLRFGKTSQSWSNNFKIINASIDYILSSKRFDEPLFQINSFISSSVNPNIINNFLFYNRQFSVLHMYLLLLLVILYSQVLFLSIFYVKCSVNL